MPGIDSVHSLTVNSVDWCHLEEDGSPVLQDISFILDLITSYNTRRSVQIMTLTGHFNLFLECALNPNIRNIK